MLVFRHVAPPALFLAFCACGPPKSSEGGEDLSEDTIASEDDDPDTTEESTTEESSSGESTSESTESTSESTSDEETGSTFVPPTDEGNPCFALSICDLWAQDCPEGERCTPYIHTECGGSTRCVPLLGDKAPGDACEIFQDNGYDCGETSYCYPGQIGVDVPSTCVEFCQGSPDAPSCPEGLVCAFDDGTLNGQVGCRPPCDPMASDCAEYEFCGSESPSQEQDACLPSL